VLYLAGVAQNHGRVLVFDLILVIFFALHASAVGESWACHTPRATRPRTI